MVEETTGCISLAIGSPKGGGGATSFQCNIGPCQLSPFPILPFSFWGTLWAFPPKVENLTSPLPLPCASALLLVLLRQPDQCYWPPGGGGQPSFSCYPNSSIR